MSGAVEIFDAYNTGGSPLQPRNRESTLPGTYDNIALGDARSQSVEFLLPKYSIREGGQTAEASQARMYFTTPADKTRSEALKAIPGINITATQSYIGFLLSQVSESRSEKVQTLPLGGDSYLATFFGDSPRNYQFSGVLYNTRNAAHRDIFKLLYEYIFRGSRAAIDRYLVQVVYDRTVVTGWITNMSQSLSASNEMMAQFNFNMLIKDETTLTPLKELGYNNAYWTGDTSGFDKLRGLDAIPEFDDYLNTARVKPPPRPRVPSGARRANCKVSRAKLRNRGKSTSGREGNRRQVTHSSPIVGNCDISQAVLDAKRGYDAAKAKILRTTKEGSAERQRKLTALNTSSSYVLGIRSAYETSASSLTNASERTRFSELRKQFSTAEALIGESNFNYASVSGAIGELDKATENSTSAPSASPPASSDTQTPEEQ